MCARGGLKSGKPNKRCKYGSVNKLGGKFEFENTFLCVSSVTTAGPLRANASATNEFFLNAFNKSALTGLIISSPVTGTQNNPIILNVYNTPYELEYFRKLFPELQYDVSLETTTKYRTQYLINAGRQRA